MTRLEIYGRTIEVTELSRVIYPGEDVMKGDVLHYYVRIAPTMMPHVRNRMVATGWGVAASPSRHRKSDDAGRALAPWIRVSHVGESGPPALVADEPASLAYLVQLGCVTPYMRLTRPEAPRMPDRVVFDLSPPDRSRAAYQAACSAARRLREILEDLDLVPFVMATGSRGLHVHVPIRPEFDADEVNTFADTVVARLMRRDRHHLATAACGHVQSAVTVDHRGSAHGHLTLAPYALRCLPGTPVATPLTWEELETTLSPGEHTMTSTFARLARQGDPWRAVDHHARSLPRNIPRSRSSDLRPTLSAL